MKVMVPNTEGTPYSCLYWDAPPERGGYLYERIGISLAEVYEKVRKFVITVC